MDLNETKSCYRCCQPSAVICVNCKEYLCRLHYNEHFRSIEAQLEKVEKCPRACLKEFSHIKENILGRISQWENEKISNIHQMTFRARKVLEDYSQVLEDGFATEIGSLLENKNENNRDLLLTSLEKLVIKYEHRLKQIKLIQGETLEIQTGQNTIEEIHFEKSHQTLSQECDRYVPQTTIGQRLIQEPSTQISVGSYWAIGASDQFLLVQEYETQALTIFDDQGERLYSVDWHSDQVIRDIQWHPNTKLFYILLDKKLLVFEPNSRRVDEVTQVHPVESNLFRRFAVSEDRIFLCYWGLQTMIDLVRINDWNVEKRWSSPQTCKTNETIAAIRANSRNQIGFSIQDESNPLNRRFRFDIRDFQLNVLHSIDLHSDGGIFSRIMPCKEYWLLINVDESWIFILNHRSELFDRIHIVHGPLFNIDSFNCRIIAVRTNQKVLLYNL